jgi:ketosteroid isomerase-like protein
MHAGKTPRMRFSILLLVPALFAVAAPFAVRQVASSADDEKAVAALDTKYQESVKKNDAATMDRILADNFVLVTGRGRTYSKADLLKEARSHSVSYEYQEDTNQTVRVWGQTAIVTALLHESGTENGKSFDYKLWFSDVYVKTPNGWRYVFGQASLPLEEKK